MAYNALGGFPTQRLSFSKKNKVWRKQCVDFADSHSILHYNGLRKTLENMKINKDLLQGKIHMEDLKLQVNPFDIDASYIPDNIQHYSVINSKLEVLKGEENKRLFDFRVTITNPNAISEMEESKNTLVNTALQKLIMDSSMNEDEYNKQLSKQDDYFKYEYQDKREVRANLLLNHYIKEFDVQTLFNEGFEDAFYAKEEAYLCDIVGGEPVLEKIDPLKMRVLMSGYSNKIEDADMVILEDYWSPGKVQDVYWDQLTQKDIDTIWAHAAGGATNNNGEREFNVAPEFGFIPAIGGQAGDAIAVRGLFDEGIESDLLPFDMNGNVRVLRVFWKSRRKIKKVKSYNPETGEEEFNFYPETYHCDPDKGEEEQVFWINQAWEGTKIGEDIYVNMRPRPIQYNRLSNPSRCHFGIIGSIYPRSIVDIMKPYAYLYDIVHDRLNKLLAKNVGKVVRLDLAKKPKTWEMDEWLYYLNTHGVMVENSWNEGSTGQATGRLAASLNNNTSGVVDLSLGQEITQYINYLEWISNEIGNLAGISKQREGQISNRETVGGVERATLQSSHSTEWLFIIHDSVKKRALECLLETAKIAYRGRKIKFDYILNDGSKVLVEFDGDEFAECDYGLVVDNSNGAQELNQKLDMLAQAGLQNGMQFSTIMKLYTTSSLAEKQRMIEASERKREEQAAQQQQIEQQQFQAELQQKTQLEQMKMEQEYKMHREKLETEIIVAQINSRAEEIRMGLMNHDNAEANTIEREKLAEEARQFDAQLALDKKKQADDARLKEKQIDKSSSKKG